MHQSFQVSSSHYRATSCSVRHSQWAPGSSISVYLLLESYSEHWESSSIWNRIDLPCSSSSFLTSSWCEFHWHRRGWRAVKWAHHDFAEGSSLPNRLCSPCYLDRERVPSSDWILGFWMELHMPSFSLTYREPSSREFRPTTTGHSPCPSSVSSPPPVPSFALSFVLHCPRSLALHGRRPQMIAAVTRATHPSSHAFESSWNMAFEYSNQQLISFIFHIHSVFSKHNTKMNELINETVTANTGKISFSS